MFSTASTLTANLTTGTLTPSSVVSARAALTITLTGTGSAAAGNARAALYRFNRQGVDGTLVATCNTFTGPVDAFSGSMSLNTTELVAAFTAIEAVRQYEKLRFDLLIWDASASVYTIFDHLDVSYEFALSAAAAASVTPITGTTDTWGNLKLSGGTIYVLNLTDGEYYPLRLAGADDQVHVDVPGDGGIVL